MGRVGQECVNFLKVCQDLFECFPPLFGETHVDQAALILAKELKQPVCPTVARRDLVGDEI